MKFVFVLVGENKRKEVPWNYTDCRKKNELLHRSKIHKNTKIYEREDT